MSPWAYYQTQDIYGSKKLSTLMKSRPQRQSAHLEPCVIQDTSTLLCVLSNSLNGISKDNNTKCSVFTLISFQGIWTSTRRLFSFSLGTEYILTIASIQAFPFLPQCSNLPRSDIQSLQTFTDIFRKALYLDSKLPPLMYCVFTM